MQCHQKLSCAECDDAPHRIVGRDANRYAVTGNDLDTEAPHPAAQLSEDFMARIALHAIQAAGMHRNNRSLHINEIVFAQQLILSRKSSNECATGILRAQLQRIVSFGASARTRSST